MTLASAWKSSSLFTKSLGRSRHTQYVVDGGQTHGKESRSERGAETRTLYTQPAGGKRPHSADQQRQSQPGVRPDGDQTNQPLRPSASGVPQERNLHRRNANAGPAAGSKTGVPSITSPEKPNIPRSWRPPEARAIDLTP